MNARRSSGAPLRPNVAFAAVLPALVALGASSGCGGGGDPEPVITTTLALRPDTPGNNELYRFDPGDAVETFGSKGGEFLIHFARDGANAVPGADADMSGVPDFVEEVASIYDEVYAHYHGSMGFRAPTGDENIPVDNGGDARFDVYLVDFGGIGDGVFRIDGCQDNKPGTCAGYMVQENDYKGYGYPSTTVANRILGSHEFFHAVQAAYDAEQGSIMAEGTAVWATEAFDPSLKDFEGFIDGYLENTDRSLNEPLPGPVDPFSYGSAIFFKFLSERYGEPMIRSLWERCEDGAGGVQDPSWFTSLDPLLAEMANTSFAAAFVEFATWNMFTGNAADPARGYAGGTDYPTLDYKDVAAPFTDDAIRVFRASSQYYRIKPEGRAVVTAAVVPHKEAPEEVAGLAMLFAVKRNGKFDSVVLVTVITAADTTIDTAGAENAIVVVINTRTEGDSRRPGLCIGTPEEVAACRSALLPVDPPPPPPPPPAQPSPPQDEVAGCTCEIPAPAPMEAPFPAAPAALLAGLALRRWRRRPRRRA